MIRSFVLALTIFALPAQAQQGVQPSGSFTPGHTVQVLNPSGTAIGDAGGSAGSALPGQDYLTELGITNTGAPLCINDALTNNPAGYHQLCLGANAFGGGVLSYNAVGGATELPLQLIVNGVTTTLPQSGSCIGCGTMAAQNADAVAISGGTITGVTITGHASLDLASANNLSDVANAATARTNLGLGTIATQNANAVAITGGTITGATITGGALTGPVAFNVAQNTVYVATTGSDSNTCLSSGQACLTIQHAYDVGIKYDAGNNDLIINVGTGTITGSTLIYGPLRGGNMGTGAAMSPPHTNGGNPPLVRIVGVDSAGSTVVQSTTGGFCGTIIVSGGAQVLLSNIELRYQGSCGGGAEIFAQEGGVVATGSGVFFGTVSTANGATSGSQVHLEHGAGWVMGEAYGIRGGAPNYHLTATGNSYVMQDGAVLITCTNSPNFSYFLDAEDDASVSLFNVTHSGCSSVTGGPYKVSGNAIIDGYGNSPATTLPGSGAALVQSGGQYINPDQGTVFFSGSAAGNPTLAVSTTSLLANEFSMNGDLSESGGSGFYQTSSNIRVIDPTQVIHAIGGTDVTATGSGYFRPQADNTFTNGQASLKWSDTQTVLLHATGAVTLTGISNAAGDQILCYNTSGGAVTYEPAVASCVPSALRFKDPFEDVSLQKASDRLDMLHAAVWTYKDKVTWGERPYVGLYADDVKKMDPRCVDYDKDGKLANYEDRCVIAYLVATVQLQKKQIAQLQHKRAR